MIALLISAALAANEPHSGVSFKTGEVDPASISYIHSYTYCFEDAAIETKQAPQAVRTSRFEECRVQRPAMLAKYVDEKQASPSASRTLQRALNIVENAYAKAMGVALPKKR